MGEKSSSSGDLRNRYRASGAESAQAAGRRYDDSPYAGDEVLCCAGRFSGGAGRGADLLRGWPMGQSGKVAPRYKEKVFIMNTPAGRTMTPEEVDARIIEVLGHLANKPDLSREAAKIACSTFRMHLEGSILAEWVPGERYWAGELMACLIAGLSGAIGKQATDDYVAILLELFNDPQAETTH